MWQLGPAGEAFCRCGKLKSGLLSKLAAYIHSWPNVHNKRSVQFGASVKRPLSPRINWVLFLPHIGVAARQCSARIGFPLSALS